MRLWMLVLASWAAPAALGAATTARFTRLSVEQGLSQSTVQAILQDHVGFVWLATEEGLNRYDGYSFVVFRHDPKDPKSLPDDRLSALYADRERRLWIGTERGLALYDHRTATITRIPAIAEKVNRIVEDHEGTLWVATDGGGLFVRRPDGTVVSYTPNPANRASLSSWRLFTVLLDRVGRLWAGNLSTGLDRLDKQRQEFVHYRHDPRDRRSLSHDEVWGLAEDAEGDLWVATYGGGLNVLDHDSGAFRHYRHRTGDPASLGSDLVTCVFVDRSGTVWAGTDGAGVQRYDRAADRFTTLSHDRTDPASLSSSVVRSIDEDAQGQLWVGTYLGGVNVLKRPQRAFGYFTHDARDPSSLSDPAVASFLEDAEGRLWIGTEQGWLNRQDRDTAAFVGYRFPSTAASGSAILALHQDRRGRIWVGSYKGGLGRFDPGRGTFEIYKRRPGDPTSLSNDQVWAIEEDEDGALWLGTNVGLDRFDPDRGVVTLHYETPSAGGLGVAPVRALLRDRQGNLWVGTMGGLNLRLRGGGGLVRYRHDPGDPRSLSHDGVISLHEDGHGVVWVGTFGGGLNRLDQAKGVATAYKQFPSNVIYGIEEDAAGRLWVSTNHGLSRLDPATESIENFDLTNGLQSLQFHMGASSKTRDGRLLFGSMDGFHVFDPQAIRPDPYAPPIVITALRVFNQPVRLPASVSTVEEVTLSHRDKVFSLEFAALDYTMPRRNQYAYRLEGFSDQWVSLGSRHEVTFTNLDPGSYVFRVKASNSDGIWSETSATRLRIVVAPAFWETWWFRALCLVAVVLVVVAGDRFRTRARRSQAADRARAESALREAEQKYRSIVDNVMEGIFQSTPDGRFLTVNPAMARMLGYATPAEMLADVTSIEQQFYASPSDRLAFLRDVETRGAVRDFEHEVRRRDGSTIWVRENARVVRGEAGRVLYYEGTVEDVTDRHRAREAEKALHEGLARAALEWERTFDAIDALVVVLDEHGRIRRINRSAREACGDAGGCVGRRVTELAAGEPWAMANELAREVAYTAERVRTMAHDRSSGRTWEVTATPLTGFEDEGHTIVVAREVSASAPAGP